MDAEIKAKWIEALRSGTYRQGRGKLRSIDDEFCCLGVLCDLVAPKSWALDDDAYAMHGERGALRQSITELTGGLGGAQESILIEMNDGGRDQPRRSFSEIADYIEEYL